MLKAWFCVEFPFPLSFSYDLGKYFWSYLDILQPLFSIKSLLLGKSVWEPIDLCQWFSPGAPYHSGVPQEFLKHGVPDYLVRGTDLFSLRLSNLREIVVKKMTTANTRIAAWCEWIKIIPIFFIRSAKNIFVGVLQNFSNLCVPQGGKGWKLLLYAVRATKLLVQKRHGQSPATGELDAPERPLYEK